MCGIAGCNWSDDDGIRRATRALAHRGPDDEGYFVNEAVSLGHRRLSILDLTPAGHQPMFYDRDHGACSAAHAPERLPAAPLGIVYNGEIYNYMAIRAELETLGYRFTTRCDTEVILAAYLAWGLGCLSRFNGMWALALYDRKAQRLILARDRMGVKPLYLCQTGGRFAFGSELKVLTALLGRFEMDPDSLAHYSAFGFTPPGRTLLAGIEKLNPGEALILDLPSQQVTHRAPFWQLPWPETAPESTGPDPAPRLRELLSAAVQRRLIADVPVGAFLSGGVDSSIIVALMRPHVRDLKTFSVRFDHPAYDESRWSRQIADRLATDHYELPFGCADLRALMPRLPLYFDDPLGDPSMVPTFLVSQVARQHVAVSLSGTGGDELFAGYPRFREYLWLRQLRRLPTPVRQRLPALYGRRHPDRARKLAGLLAVANDDWLYGLLFSHRFRTPGPPPVDMTKFPHLNVPANPKDPLQPLLDFEQRVYLAENLLIKEDRASMAHGLETRTPFLDFTLVTFANSLHHRWKLRGRRGKYILKAAFADVLPAAIANRPKMGFGFPLAEYLRGDLRETAREILFDPSMATLVDPHERDHLWTEHQSGRSDYAHALWCMLILNLWRDHWLR